MIFKEQKIARLAAIASLMVVTASAHAADSGFDQVMASVDLTGVGTKVIAALLLVVGVAIAFKGGDIAKRVIRKV